MRLRITLALLLLSSWSVQARENAPAADFSDALAKLAALGLPEMKGAEWVKPPKGNHEAAIQSYEFRQLGATLEGGTWKLAGDPPRLLDFGRTDATATAEEPKAAATPSANPGLLERMLRNHAASQPKKEPEPKAGPSPAADAKRLAEALGKGPGVERLLERLEYDSDVLEVPARCLVFAAQLHAAGETAAANELAAAVFAAFPDPVGLIDAAVGIFAAAEHERLTGAFFEGHDWTAYRDGLKALLEKYPRGWRDAAGVTLLLAALDEKIANPAPPVPALPGIELKPEAVEQLGKLLEVPSAPGGGGQAALPPGFDLSEIPAEHRAQFMAMLRQQGMGMSLDQGASGLWILSANSGEQVPKSPVAALQAMGMDGLIALAAVATDPTLTPARNRQSGFRSGDASPHQLYNSLDRPRTRGEIACTILASTLPRGEDDHQFDPAAIQGSTVSFWNAHRGKSSVELALLFMAEGDDNQRQQAAMHLASQDDPAARQALEKMILSSDQASIWASTVETYLDRRKQEGRALFDAYAKLLTAELDGIDLDDLRGSYQIRQAGSVEKYLKKLSMKVGAVSLDELIADMLKQAGDEDDAGDERSPLESLGDAMAGVATVDCLKAVATAAPQAKPAQWMDLLQLQLTRIYRDHRRGKKPEAVTLSPDLVESWRALVAKTEPLPEDHEFTDWVTGYGGTTLGDAAALVIETAVHPDSGESYTTFARVCDAPETTASFVKKRVDAWMSGKEPSAWPDAKKVAAPRREELRTKLASLAAGDIAPFIKSLGLDERFAVGEIVAAFDEDHPAPAGLLELRDTVVDLRPYNPSMPHDPATLEKLGISRGFKASPDELSKLAAKLAESAKDFSGTSVSFYEAPMGLGNLASGAQQKDMARLQSDYQFHNLAQALAKKEDAPVMAALYVENASDFWTVKDGKVEHLDPQDDGSSALFRLKRHGESKAMEIPYVMVLVLTRADAEQILNSESEEE